jgi:hypothetical protein
MIDTCVGQDFLILPKAQVVLDYGLRRISAATLAANIAPENSAIEERFERDLFKLRGK